MNTFDEIVETLAEKHRSALTWFFRNRDTQQRWPKPLSDGTLLASKAQGIYKPKWCKYCLSIRQSLRSRYADRDVQMRRDGTWSLVYAQEASDPRSRDADYANRSLIACMEETIPIGVLKQISHAPVSRYLVLGVALVLGHHEGYFLIEGFAADGAIRGQESPQALKIMATIQEGRMDLAGAFDPESIVDARERILTSIIRRRGQPKFRHALLEAYDGKCAITGCEAEDALEAAHITPYLGTETNRAANGLLLRADVHILFDMGLITVDTSNMTLLVSPDLQHTEYHILAGKHLRFPDNPSLAPNTEALNRHRSWAGL